MHITGTNGGTTVFSGTDILSESGVSTGYQSYDGSFNFSGVLKSLTIEIGGRNINLAVGPLFDDVSVNVFYNVINTIIEQQITTVEEIVYLNIFDSVEIEEPQQEEVTYETVEVEIQEIQTDFKVDIPEPEIQMAEMEMEMEIELEIEAELEETIEVASVEEPVEESTEKPVEETKEKPVEETKEEPVEEIPVESESSPEPVEEKPEEVEEPEEKPANEPSAKEKAATKIVKDIDDKERYDDTAQTKTLLVMQILGDTKTFFTPTQSFTEVDVGEYLNKTIEDQYGMLFDMAQENTI
jgi:hypothetical protein